MDDIADNPDGLQRVDDARQASTYAEGISDQLEQQGGVKALAALQPEDPVSSATPRPLQIASLWDAPAEPAGSQCPLCDSTVAPGSIAAEPPQLFLPNGRLVAGPTVLKGADAKRWLKEHGRFARIHAA